MTSEFFSDFRELKSFMAIASNIPVSDQRTPEKREHTKNLPPDRRGYGGTLLFPGYRSIFGRSRAKNYKARLEIRLQEVETLDHKWRQPGSKEE